MPWAEPANTKPDSKLYPQSAKATKPELPGSPAAEWAQLALSDPQPDLSNPQSATPADAKPEFPEPQSAAPADALPELSAPQSGPTANVQPELPNS